MCDTCHELWLTVAQSHLLMSEFEEAYDTLKKASQLDGSHWQIWRDLSLLSGLCGHFDEMINAYHGLLNLKPDYLNIKLLETLTYGIISKMPSIAESSVLYNALREEALKLSVRLVGYNEGNASLWGLYACMTAHAFPVTDEVTRKTKKCLEFALKTATQPLWYISFSGVFFVLDLCRVLIDVFIRCGKHFGKIETTEELVKMMFNFTSDVIENVYEYQRDVITNGVKLQFISRISSLENKLQELTRI